MKACLNTLKNFSSLGNDLWNDEISWRNDLHQRVRTCTQCKENVVSLKDWSWTRVHPFIMKQKASGSHTDCIRAFDSSRVIFDETYIDDCGCSRVLDEIDFNVWHIQAFKISRVTDERFLLFITPILKPLVVAVIWLALIGAIYSRNTPFFYLKSHLFPSQWGGHIKNKTTT